MTLITAIVGGLACGYLLGFGQRALLVFLGIWLTVLAVQTAFVLDPEDVPPEDWSYAPVQIVILMVAVAMIWLGAKIRSRFAPS